MGYDLHITRKQSWDDADVIEPAEWLAAVATVGGFSPVTQSQVGDSVLNLPPEWHSQRWNEHPEVPGAGPRFRLTSGSVTLGGGDTATLHIAFKLADVLGARIIGDEGEAYDLGYISGPRDEAGWKTKNPFTGEPIYSERVGVLESHGSEWHLVTSKRALLRRRSTEERALLYWVEPFPPPSPGSTIRVRGTVSEPGKYGSDRSCEVVLYVLKVVA